MNLCDSAIGLTADVNPTWHKRLGLTTVEHIIGGGLVGYRLYVTDAGSAALFTDDIQGHGLHVSTCSQNRTYIVAVNLVNIFDNVVGPSFNGDLNVISRNSIELHLIVHHIRAEAFHFLAFDLQTGHLRVVDELDVVDQHFVVVASLTGIGIGGDGYQYSLRVNGVLRVNERNRNANPLTAGGGNLIILSLDLIEYLTSSES